jgi:hypothetical protein
VPPPAFEVSQPGAPGLLKIPLASGATVELDPAQLAGPGGAAQLAGPGGAAQLAALDLSEAERAEVAGFLGALQAAVQRWAL